MNAPTYSSSLAFAICFTFMAGANVGSLAYAYPRGGSVVWGLLSFAICVPFALSNIVRLKSLCDAGPAAS